MSIPTCFYKDVIFKIIYLFALDVHPSNDPSVPVSSQSSNNVTSVHISNENNLPATPNLKVCISIQYLFIRFC